MIPNITQGGYVRGLMDYLFKKEKQPLILDSNDCRTDDKKTIINDFLLLQKENTKLKKYLMHISFSASKDDFKDIDQNDDKLLTKRFNDYLKNYVDELYETTKKTKNPIDLRNTQYVSVLHKDTDHPHFHVVFNRIKIDKDYSISTVKDNMIKTASNRVSYRLAEKYGLKLSKIKKTQDQTKKQPNQSQKTPSQKDLKNEMLNIYEDIYQKTNTKKKYRDKPKNTIIKNEIYPVFKKAKQENNINDFFNYLSQNIAINHSPIKIKNDDKNDDFINYLTYQINPYKIKQYRLFFARPEFYYKNNELRFLPKEVSPEFSQKKIQDYYGVSKKDYQDALTKNFKKPQDTIYKLINSAQNLEQLHQKIETSPCQYSLKKKDQIIKGIDSLPKGIRYADIKMFFEIKHKKPTQEQTFYNFSVFEKEIQNIKSKMMKCYNQADSLDNFEKLLNNEQITLIKKYDSKNRFVGATFLDDAIKINGSFIHSQFSASKLNTKFEIEKSQSQKK